MHHFLRHFFEILCGIVVFALLAFGLLMGRLDRGSLQIASLIPDIEAEMSRAAPGLSFKIDDAQIDSNDRYRAINVKLQGLHILNADHEVVGTLREINMGFNWRNLASFSWAPVSVEVVAPSLEITRFPNGYVGYTLKENDQSEKHPVSLETITGSLKNIPVQLRRILIREASIHYDDQLGDFSFDAGEGLFDFHRRKNDMSGTLSLHIKTANFEQSVQGTVSTDPKTGIARMTIGLKNFFLNQARAFASAIPADLNLDLPMDVLLTAGVNKNLQLAEIDLQATGKAGTVTYPPYLPDVLPVNDVLLTTKYLPQQRKFSLDTLVFSLEKAKVSATGSANFIPVENDPKAFSTNIHLKALAENVLIDKLPQYWPHELAHHARDWVTTRIHEGNAEHAAIETTLTVHPDKTVQIEKLDGQIDFKNASVNYLPPMPEITGVDGTATFDQNNFNIEGRSGHVYDSGIKTANVKISDLLHGPKMDIQADIEGPLRDAITIISSKPLEYPQHMGFIPDQFSGNAKTHLGLQFPLVSTLKIAEVGMKTTAQLENVTVKNVVKNVTATASKLDFTVDTNSLNLEGDAILADAPTHIKWTEDFSHDAEEPTQLDIKGIVTPKFLMGLNLPVKNYFSGSADTQAQIRQARDKTLQISVSSDLRKATIMIPEINVAKNAGMRGNADFKITNDPSGALTIAEANVAWPDFSIAQGMARWNKNKELESATLKNIKAGRTQASVVVTPLTSNITRVIIQGKVIDLSQYWSHPRDKETSGNQALNVSLRTDTLYLDPEIPLQNVKADIGMIGDDLLTADITAQADKNSPLRIHQTSAPNKARTLSIEADNAGKVLQALDVSDAVYGGLLTIKGQSTAQNPKALFGKMVLTDFSMVKAPVLARLLNALSPGGLLNLLNKNGLSFSRMQSDFAMPDKNTITLSKGKMNGASLGLSFRGNVDRENKTVNIRGTIIQLKVSINSSAKFRFWEKS